MTRDEAIENLIEACEWLIKGYTSQKGQVVRVEAEFTSGERASLGTANFDQIRTALKALEPEPAAHWPLPAPEIQKSDLPNLINWREVMKAERYAGGHTEVFDVLFLLAEVIGTNFEGTYDGTVAYTYEFPNGQVVIVCDAFGSCSGCDLWEGADDDDCRALVKTMVNNARIFPDREAAREWTLGARNAEDYLFEAAGGLKLA